jgi:hypothetical protein
MISPDAVRAMITHLENLVVRNDDGTIGFQIPSHDALIDAGLEQPAVDRLLEAAWLDEMVADVVETPEYCEPDAAPDEVLRFAKDAIKETIWKRFER